jgi:GGDEF domain-containing protein
MPEDKNEFPEAVPTHHGHFEGPATEQDYIEAQSMNDADVAQLRFQERQSTRELTEKEAEIYDDITKLLKGSVFRKAADARLAKLNHDERRMMRPNNAIIGSYDGKGLKALNDTEGHEAGNMMLFNIGTILKEVAREDDLVSRQGEGSDEFGSVFFFRDDVIPTNEMINTLNENLMRLVQEAVARGDIKGLKWKFMPYEQGKDIRYHLDMADPVPGSDGLMEFPPKEVLPSRDERQALAS